VRDGSFIQPTVGQLKIFFRTLTERCVECGNTGRHISAPK